MRTFRRYRLTFQSGGMCTVGSMAQRIELFSAGCPVCVEGEALVQIDSWSEDDASWLQSTLRFITREAGEF